MEKAPRSKPNTQPVRQTRTQSTGNRVLVIDDDLVIHRLIGMILAGNGYQCDSAYGVEQALEQIARAQPDLIFLDLMMPELDGLDFLRMRSKSLILKAIPVFILSAVGDSSLLQQARSLDVVGHLLKPFGKHQLLGLVHQTLHAYPIIDGPK